MDYNKSGHVKHNLKVHIILVSKYRKPIFKNNLSDDIKQFIYDASKLYKYNIIEMETDIDHIHILLEYSPKHSISNIIKNLKQYSTYKMWKIHNLILSKHYWKQKILWSDGYFTCSIGEVSESIIKQYIKKQG